MTLTDQMTALKTILIKEVLRFSRIWVQTILPPAITMALYFVIFGKLIGSAIDTSATDGYSYIDYIVPGLIMMSVITNSYSNVVSSFYSAKYQGHIQELLVSPTPNTIILIGFIGGGVIRGLMVGAIVTLVSLFFTDMDVQHPFLTVITLFLTSVLFATAGLINAVYAKSFDDISIVPVFVLTPLTYLGGVFYSIKLLSPFWQTMSLVNPVLYMVNGFRYGILGVSDISIYISLAIILIFIVILFSIAYFLLDKGVGIRS
ncbi:ABC transporter permease [Leucothrix pacifica]|uniref:Transport permease protein n=1 Tax=Leucothrix pacifica TaxID=1247513 RepID=A0A317CGE5_9GAMM|nr:ABC transporter permease [Leucothrix pacifica]PWQ97447.1 ABC transporter permease [Leucothrix pacifica]